MARRNTTNYSWQRYRVEDQVTQPIPLGNLAFRSYLSTHCLSPLDVARVSEARYSTLWYIEHDVPSGGERAALVGAELRRITGCAYTGPIMLRGAEKRPLHEPLRTQRSRHDGTK